jgi:hypothetical protein
MRVPCQKCGFINEVTDDFHVKGGKARAASMTPEERSRNAKKAAKTKRKKKKEARWPS